VFGTLVDTSRFQKLQPQLWRQVPNVYWLHDRVNDPNSESYFSSAMTRCFTRQTQRQQLALFYKPIQNK